jgi:hypothetical protein
MLEGTVAQGRVGRGDVNFCWLYRPREGDGAVACAWSLAEKPLPASLPAGFEVFDRFGNPLPPKAFGISAAPVYVKGPKVEALRAALVPILDPPRRLLTVRDFQVCGPFDNPRYGDLRYGLFTDYTPDQRVNLRDRMAGIKGGEVRWTPVQAREDGLLDLSKTCGVLNYALAYAACWVRSPDERDTELSVGSDDGVRVRVNGQIVLSHLTERGVYPEDDNRDKDIVPVRLRKGWNQVLLKVEQGIGGWSLQVKILDPKGDLELSGSPH